MAMSPRWQMREPCIPPDGDEGRTGDHMTRMDRALDFIADIADAPDLDGVLARLRDVVGAFGFEQMLVPASADAAPLGDGQVVLVGWDRDDLAHRLAGTTPPPTLRVVETAPSEPSATLQRRPRRASAAAARADQSHAAAAPGVTRRWALVPLTPGAADLTAGERAVLRLIGTLVDDRLRAIAARAAAPTERPLLSPRERECLQWTSAGKTTWEIASILAISQNTTDGYIASATKKLGAVNRTQAVAEALRRGLIA